MHVLGAVGIGSVGSERGVVGAMRCDQFHWLGSSILGRRCKW